MTVIENPTAPTESEGSSSGSAFSALLSTLKTRNPVPTADKRRRPPWSVVAGAIVVVLLVLAAAVPSLLAPYDPFAINLDATLSPPSWSHLFGTDLNGRDLFSRVIYGTRESLGIGLGAVAVATVLAVFLGIAAGLSGRIAGALANRWIEIMFAFPTVLLGLTSGVGVRPRSVDSDLCHRNRHRARVRTHRARPGTRRPQCALHRGRYRHRSLTWPNPAAAHRSQLAETDDRHGHIGYRPDDHLGVGAGIPRARRRTTSTGMARCSTPAARTSLSPGGWRSSLVS